MKVAARLLAAIAEPSRLAILALLSRSDRLCVCEIQAVLGLSQSRASRHLKTLRDAGLLEDDRVGIWVHYRITPRPGRRQAAILAALDDLLGPDARADIARRLADRDRASASGCEPAAPPEGARP